MRSLKFALPVLLLAALSLGSCHVGRFFIWNFSDIRDNKKFRQKILTKTGPPFIFSARDTGTHLRLPKSIKVKKKVFTFDELLEKTGTVAFLVIRNDSLLYERYLNGYGRATPVPSFSVAKSFTSVLVGIAIDEGAIGSVYDPVTKYIPELKPAGFDKVTIEHLLNMHSGIRSGESYSNPFGGVAKLYYGRNLKKYIKRLKLEDEPGGAFKYQSVNTQVLGLIVERATGKLLPDYMQEKVWQHIGAEYDAGWSIDSRKHEAAKAFCCFNACAIDYAKMGRLYLKNGNWNGKQIVSEKWVKESLSVAVDKNGGMYSYQWWHTRPSDFFAQGHLGQYVYVLPAKNIIIVRLGKKYGIDAWAGVLKGIADAN
jgi:CubicO group peptidase (beta-lactamase class C family)